MGGFGSVAPFEAPAYNGDLLDDADWETVEGLSAAKEAVMWLRRKASAATTFQRRLEQKNPYLFIEYWKEGARPFENQEKCVSNGMLLQHRSKRRSPR